MPHPKCSMPLISRIDQAAQALVRLFLAALAWNADAVLDSYSRTMLAVCTLTPHRTRSMKASQVVSVPEISTK
jgi:23S rRNA maturation mini-RNase III